MEITKQIEEYLNFEKINEAEKLIKKLKREKYFFYYYAEILRIKGFVKKAIYYYKKAMEKMKEKKFEIILKIISLYRTTGEKNKAKKYIKMAEKINPNSIELMIEKAMYFRLIEKYENAVKIFKRLLKYYIKNKDYQAVSYINWAVGGIYRNKGDLKKSIKYFQKAIEYSKTAKDESMMIYSILGLAGVLRIRGDLKRSYNLYYLITKKAPKTDIFAKAYSFCGTGNALRQMGKIEEALKYYKTSLKLYEKIKDNPDTALVLWGMAECYKKTNIKKAIQCIRKAKKLLKNSYEIRGKILLKKLEAEIKYSIGNKKEAKKLFEEAYNLAKKHKLNTLVETFG